MTAEMLNAIANAAESGVVAPSSSLPSWGECQTRVGNSDFIAKRVAEGGYGAEADSLPTAEVFNFRAFDRAVKDAGRDAETEADLEARLAQITMERQS